MLHRVLCHTLTVLTYPLVSARFMIVSTLIWHIQEFFMIVHTIAHPVHLRTSVALSLLAAAILLVCSIIRFISTLLLCLRTSYP
jgi:hypothetical protein